jgi:hypothetical protein
MNKLRIVAVCVTIIALTAVSGAAKKPALPDKSATEYAIFGAAPGGTADIVGEGVVGTNVWTYSPQPIILNFSNDAFGNAWKGPQTGFARCLKKNGPEGGRLDFFFACGGSSDLGDCSYRLVVRDGIYDRKTDADVFDPGSVLIDYTKDSPNDPPVFAGFASFSIEYAD